MNIVRLTAAALICLAAVATAKAVGPSAQPLRDPSGPVVPVRAWNPDSVQTLVRIAGRLYQQEDDLYLPVISDTISARLSDDVADWESLVNRAVAAAPDTFRVLEQLTPLRINRLGIQDLRLPQGGDPADWAELVYRTGLVEYAEVGTYGVWTAAPDDPRYPDQWGHNNTGQYGGVTGADISSEAAWELTTGDPAVVVAVLDSGTDLDHEDLAANVWHNSGEIAGNGVDDDGNGFVDDWEGWDFDGNDNDPRGTYYHGTHVTGVVNAVRGNGIGIAGLAGGDGGSGVRGMALNIGNSSPNSSVVDDAILYAADNGADVITLSLAIGSSQAINNALDYAYNDRDVFIDCASGNDSSSVRYPATRPEVMAVAATDDDDSRSWFSNFGPEIEVAAPGSNILSTRLNDTYGPDDGTSFASPRVGALAALIRSRNPGLSASDVRQLIIDTADDVEAAGFDNQTGHGRINAYEAVLNAAVSDGLVRFGAEAYGCGALLELTVSDIDLAGTGTVTVHVTSDTEPAGEDTTLIESGGGSGVFRGTLPVDTAAPAADGILQVTALDLLTAEYLDADDGQGGSGVLKTDTASVDCDPPVVYDVEAGSLADVAATMFWTTDETSTSVVRYGTSTPPSTSASSPGEVTDHQVALQGLSECTTYFYEVESSDGPGNVTVDDRGGAWYTFETWRNLPETGPVPCHQGQVLLDRDDGYGCSGAVQVTVIDIDLDTDPDQVETVDIFMTSSAEPGGEWFTLHEIEPSNSRFQGTVPLSGGPPGEGDGMLSVHASGLLTATYHDADDGISGPYAATATRPTDCVPPQIGSVRVTGIYGTRALVQWTTDEPSTSSVEFGATAALGSLAESSELVTSHSVVVSPFDFCQRAHFRVSSTDIHGDTSVVDADGAPFQFNLNQIGGLVWFENFETETGWTLEGEWQRGSPQGLGTGNADPESAWDGSYVIGNDLTGQGSFAGDYEPSALENATSPVFSTRQERDLELVIRRKLGVTSVDDVSVHVLTNGPTQIWSSGGSFYDVDWFQQRFDISAVADNKSSVQLQFRMDSNDASHSFGWNLDEIIVKDSTQPDYLVCGGCAGAPTFAGAASVTDPDPCGSGGLVVAWAAAAAWGTGTGGTYEVHRGSTPDFAPSAANRLAAGLTATSYTDSSAPVDTPVWYVVRARNDESCTADGGLDDGNLIRVGGTETVSIPPPDAVGPTLTTGGVGSAHVRLEWAPASGADRYQVHRGSLADFSDAVQIGSTAETVYEDQDAMGGNGLLLYRVYAVDGCGRSE